MCRLVNYEGCGTKRKNKYDHSYVEPPDEGVIFMAHSNQQSRHAWLPNDGSYSELRLIDIRLDRWIWKHVLEQNTLNDLNVLSSSFSLFVIPYRL